MIRKTFSVRRTALSVALLGLLAGSLHAQNIGKTTGGIRGVVNDSSGGVIPGATVTSSRSTGPTPSTSA